MRTRWLAVLALAAGCGDAADTRLQRGDPATLYAPTGSQVSVRSPTGESVALPMGTRVTIVEDGKGPDPNRAVEVNVMEGKLEGSTGTVKRYEVRPVAK